MTYLVRGPLVPGNWSLGSADASFRGEGYETGAGSSVAGVGDVNADGYDDVVVGAPSFLDIPDEERPNGAAYLLYGPRAGSQSLGDATARWSGEAATDTAGDIVAPAGDVNGDGQPDVLVGATDEDSNGFSAGAVYVLFGPPPEGESDLSLADAKIVGKHALNEVGDHVGPVGDLNGDGLDDIAIPAIGDSTVAEWSGAVYVFFGRGP